MTLPEWLFPESSLPGLLDSLEAIGCEAVPETSEGCAHRESRPRVREYGFCAVDHRIALQESMGMFRKQVTSVWNSFW